MQNYNAIIIEFFKLFELIELRKVIKLSTYKIF